jgi:hypothetical protein
MSLAAPEASVTPRSTPAQPAPRTPEAWEVIDDDPQHPDTPGTLIYRGNFMDAWEIFHTGPKALSHLLPCPRTATVLGSPSWT